MVALVQSVRSWKNTCCDTRTSISCSRWVVISAALRKLDWTLSFIGTLMGFVAVRSTCLTKEAMPCNVVAIKNRTATPLAATFQSPTFITANGG